MVTLLLTASQAVYNIQIAHRNKIDFPSSSFWHGQCCTLHPSQSLTFLAAYDEGALCIYGLEPSRDGVLGVVALERTSTAATEADEDDDEEATDEDDPEQDPSDEVVAGRLVGQDVVELIHTRRQDIKVVLLVRRS